MNLVSRMTRKVKRILAGEWNGLRATEGWGAAGRSTDPDEDVQSSGDLLSYRCNVCGGFCRSGMESLTREEPTCGSCGSTVRMRAMVRLVSVELLGKSLCLPDFPRRRDLRGIGLSDWDGYARGLARKFRYTNTFYHQKPRLDIMEVDGFAASSLDFVISTDVLEHVVPPISRAFHNVSRLLKPGGVFLFSVPYLLEGETIEHFPELHDYTLSREKGKWVLANRTVDGREQRFDDLIFHGGEGSTLQMRAFCLPSLYRHFEEAGFTDIAIRDEPDLAHGIIWSLPFSVPMTARKAR